MNQKNAVAARLISNFTLNARLSKNGIRRRFGMDCDRNTEIFLAERTAPDFMAAFALSNKHTSGSAQYLC